MAIKQRTFSFHGASFLVCCSAVVMRIMLLTPQAEIQIHGTLWW